MLSTHHTEYSNLRDKVQKLRAEIDQLKEQIPSLTISRNNLDGLHKSVVDSLTTLEISHKLTMDNLQKKRNELEESQAACGEEAGEITGLQRFSPQEFVCLIKDTI
jgi:chromosome segregation ATPase